MAPNERPQADEEANWGEIGARIRQLRRARSLSQTQLGSPIASASFVSLIESGARKPSRKVLAHIADRLKVDPDELLYGRSRKHEIGAELTLQEAREAVRKGDDDKAERLAQHAAEQARSLANKRLEARACEVLGGIEERRNRLDAALERYRRAEALWEREPPHLWFQTMAGLARCHQALGNARLAVHVLESYLLRLEREGVPDPTATMRAYAALVNCYSGLGLAEKAADAADRAQALAPQVKDAEQLACMNMNVARSMYEQGRMDDALDALQRAEQSYLTIGWEIDAAIAKLNRATVQIDKGDPDAARANLTSALEVFKAANHPSDAARTLNELGRLERVVGDLPQAEHFLRDAQQYLEGGDFSERAGNLRELGLCLQERDPTEAKAHLRRAIDLYVVAAASKEAGFTYKLLGDTHRSLGELEESAEAYRAGIEAME
ncbi:MAG: tetratricopeptide repeat protein [Actinomycetota bacterium]